ncbi:MAG: helix-turn-helix domain-containing protein, partial [Candidatus Spechtbacteria bacterium]|nr:helix-turn-helix domain-containing protein [Candidatus Spechtbacteria bacterium]
MGETEEGYNQIINLREAAKISGYTSDHVARLIRTKKINGRRIAHVWVIERGDLEKYLASQNLNLEKKNTGSMTLKDASLLSGYTSDHVARLIRTKKIAGQRVGRAWLVVRSDFEKYMADQNRGHTETAVSQNGILRSQKIAHAKINVPQISFRNFTKKNFFKITSILAGALSLLIV